MSEINIQELKEQIKRELKAEMSISKENENNWKRIKTELDKEFEKFDYINKEQRKVIAKFAVQGAIGTLLRVVYKAENVSKIKANYEEMKSIVEDILNILKRNRKEQEEVNERKTQ